MPDLGSAYVQIVPSAQGISGSISNVLEGEAGSAGDSAGSLIGENLASTLKTVIAGAGIGLAISKSLQAVGDLAEYGDNIDKMSQKMGISAQAYQEWDAILQHSGSSIEAMKPAFKTLVNQAESGSEAFQQLGISQEEVASMNQEELFARTIEELQKMDSDTERAYLAQKLLGKGGTELGALLNTSAEDTELMRQRVHELGGVMSDEAVKDAAAYQDALQDMQTAVQGLGRGLVANVLPGFTQVMEGISTIFSVDPESGVGMVLGGIANIGQAIIDAVPQFLTNIGTMISGVLETIANGMPQFIENGKQFIINLGIGLINNIPNLISKAGNLLSRLIAFILQNLPKLISAGVQIVGSLAQGLWNNIPAILRSIGGVLSQLFNTIRTNYPQYLQAGLQIIGQIASGLIQAIPKIVAAIPQVLGKIGQWITSQDWLSIGRNIISGIVNGLRAAGSAIKDFLLNLAKGALDSIKSFFGISSPSKVMAQEVGKWLPLGIAEGIEDNTKPLLKEMDNLTDMTVNAAKADIGYTATMTGKQLENSVLASGNSYSAMINRLDTMVSLMDKYYPDMADNTIDGSSLVNGIDRALGLKVV